MAFLSSKTRSQFSGVSPENNQLLGNFVENVLKLSKKLQVPDFSSELCNFLNTPALEEFVQYFVAKNG